MALAPGTRLGAYEILTLVGAGGMGEVYCARDRKLDRDVAIKVLPSEVAADPDRLARLEREAKTLAALNHPNIAHIYGVEDSTGIPALVMELVDGPTLADRIAKGPIPLDEALPIAKQIAEALEAAHEQGIIHRDLKPANIKVRPDGTVKVLDFGLAKALDPAASSSSNLSISPTITSPAMTAIGVILGTAAYMSPEQARARRVDKRADIWAFGAVLYEMLCGAPAFVGEDTTELIAAVVKTPPNLGALPPHTPAAIVGLIRGCLEKDPKARFGDIAVVRFLLSADTTLTGGGAMPANPTQSAQVPTRALPWVIASVFAAASVTLLILWAPWRAEKPTNRGLVRLDVDLGTDAALPPADSVGSSVAISPDGTRLLYVSGTPAKLFMRRLDETKTTELSGTQGAAPPLSFSPDGQWIAFVMGGRPSKISISGGAVVPLSASPARDAAWTEGGRPLVTWNVRQVGVSNGEGDAIAVPFEGGLALGEAQLLPGGRAVLFSADYPGPVDRTTIDVVTLPGRRRKTAIRGGASPRYLATGNGAGHLIYASGATLFAVPFDLDALETRGSAVPMLDDLANEPLIGIAQFDVSHTGVLVYRKAKSSSTLSTLQWVDTESKTSPMAAQPAPFQDPAVSPDGKRIAVTIADRGGTDVWMYEPARDAMTRVTFGGKVYRTPRWSPDGRFLVFSDVGHGLVQARADGAIQPRPLTQVSAYQIASSFSPDGRTLVYATAGEAGIWTLSLEEQGGALKAGAPQLFLNDGSVNPMASFSPDGRWIAYQADQAGTTEIFVRAFPASATGARWQVSNGGGTAPRWSRTTHDLVYTSGTALLAAGYSVAGDLFVPEKPRVWIAKFRPIVQANGVAWDLAADGKRAAMVTSLETAASTPDHEVVFLLNFFDELRRRAPLGK